MKDHLKIEFHNPNSQEETGEYLCSVLVDMLMKIIEENPEIIFEKASLLMGGGEIENCSLL